MLAPNPLRLAFLTAFLIGCSSTSSEPADVPMPHDPSTREPGVDTVRPAPPSPGVATENGAPLHNDDAADPHDPAKEQGGGARSGDLAGSAR